MLRETCWLRIQWSIFMPPLLEVLTLMLLVANSANTKLCKKPEKWVKLLQMGTHMKVLSESFPMNTNMTGFRCFSKIFASLHALDKSSLSIGRVN